MDDFIPIGQLFKMIKETENFIVEYDKLNNVYRVSYFEDNHFKEEVFFKGVE